MLTYQIFPPCEELKAHVSRYLITEVSDSNELPFTTEVYPMNIPALNFQSRPGIYKYRDSNGAMNEAPVINIVGQMICSGITEFAQPGLIATVIFTPTGLHKIFGVNMQLITDKAVDAGVLIGKNELTECSRQIFEAPSIKAGLEELNRYLLKWSTTLGLDLRKMDKMASLINSRKGNVNIDWLSGQANMSAKTFERHFLEKIGITPKLFSRISRFSHSLKMLLEKSDLFSVLDECGYTDQAHFIKECRRFCGKTPKFCIKDNEDLSRYFLSHFVKD